MLRSPTPAAAASVGGLRGLSSRISFLVAVGAVFAAVGGSWIPVAVALDHAAAAAPAPPFSAAVPETAASPWSTAGAERKAVASSVVAPRPPPTRMRKSPTRKPIKKPKPTRKPKPLPNAPCTDALVTVYNELRRKNRVAQRVWSNFTGCIVQVAVEQFYDQLEDRALATVRASGALLDWEPWPGPTDDDENNDEQEEVDNQVEDVASGRRTEPRRDPASGQRRTNPAAVAIFFFTEAQIAATANLIGGAVLIHLRYLQDVQGGVVMPGPTLVPQPGIPPHTQQELREMAQAQVIAAVMRLPPPRPGEPCAMIRRSCLELEKRRYDGIEELAKMNGINWGSLTKTCDCALAGCGSAKHAAKCGKTQHPTPVPSTAIPTPAPTERPTPAPTQKPTLSCNSQAYDPEFYECCDTVIYLKMSGYQCCGSGYYDIQTQHCCNGEVVKEANECCEASDTYCGPQPGQCTSSPCCPPQIECRDRCYDPSVHLCCGDGNLVAIGSCCPQQCCPGQCCKGCCGRHCGSSYGDPHLVTFDGLSYDCQVRGEYVLAKSGTMQVQGRFEHDFRWSSFVTRTTAVAVTDGPGTPTLQLELESTTGAPALYVDGNWINVTVEGFEDDRVRVLSPAFNDNAFHATYKASGLVVHAQVAGPYLDVIYLDVIVGLPPAYATAGTVGLLGSADNDPANDWMTPNGTVISDPQDLFPRIGYAADRYCSSNWCIRNQSDSLFLYHDTERTFSNLTGCDDPLPEPVDLSLATTDLQNLCGTNKACLIDGIVLGEGAARNTLETEASLAEDLAWETFHISPTALVAGTTHLLTFTVNASESGVDTATTIEAFQVYRINSTTFEVDASFSLTLRDDGAANGSDEVAGDQVFSNAVAFGSNVTGESIAFRALAVVGGHINASLSFTKLQAVRIYSIESGIGANATVVNATSANATDQCTNDQYCRDRCGEDDDWYNCASEVQCARGSYDINAPKVCCRAFSDAGELWCKGVQPDGARCSSVQHCDDSYESACAQGAYPSGPKICCRAEISFNTGIYSPSTKQYYCEGIQGAGAFCDNNYLCASGACVNGTCLAQKIPAGRPCPEKDYEDCATGGCGRATYPSGPYICCPNDRMVDSSFSERYCAGIQPAGGSCNGTGNSICASGVCSGSVCLAQKISTGQPCPDGESSDCANNACGGATYPLGPSVCCLSGSIEYSSYPDHRFYCTEQPNGASCSKNAMCASGVCSGSVCLARTIAAGKPCPDGEFADCANSVCGRTTYPSGAYVCCPSGSLEREYSPTESRNIYYCTGQPNGASCFNNRMCTSGLCRTGKCRPP